MTLNPGGFQQPFDFGIPQYITGKAADEVSGGQIAYLTSGTSQAVGSTVADYAHSDLLFNVPASGTNYPIGVVTQNAGSTDACTVMVRGTAILPASTAITAGQKVAVLNGASAVDVYTSGTATTSLLQHQSFGRALTTAASGGFVLVHVGGL